MKSVTGLVDNSEDHSGKPAKVISTSLTLSAKENGCLELGLTWTNLDLYHKLDQRMELDTED